MADLILQPTSTAQWLALVSEAESTTGHILGEELECYLVFLLMRFADKPHMMSRVLALDYLDAGYMQGGRYDRMREVGDHCLLFSGLFPKQAERRMVKVSYFVGVGQSAYQQVADLASERMAEVYMELAREFVTLMDILQTMRELRDNSPRMTPLHAFDLWNDTGSRHAYKVITSITDACPIWNDDGDNGFVM